MKSGHANLIQRRIKKKEKFFTLKMKEQKNLIKIDIAN